MSNAIVNVSTAIPLLILDALGVGKTGLTVTSSARLVGSTTTVTATVTERTNGEYDSAFTATSVGLWRVISTATVDGDPFVDATDVQVLTAAQADPAAALATARVTLVSPVTATGDRITIYQGDDYQAAESRQLSWTLTGAPDLTGATITLVIETGDAGWLSVTATCPSPGGITQVVTATLSHIQTAALIPTTLGDYDLSAVLANTDAITLSRGAVTVIKDVR